MAQLIEEIMNPNPTTYPATTPLDEAARAMRDTGIGDVLVTDDGTLCGIVTDRDMVVRAVAENRPPSTSLLGEICSRQLVSLSPADTVAAAVQLMRDNAFRRLPICTDGEVVGIVSLGDLAVAQDPASALADISAMPPNG
jgi:CBS domain-containing protein